MKTKEFLLKLTDLFLQSDKASADWVKVPSLRWTSYLLFITGLSIVVFNIGMRIPLHSFVKNSETLTTVFRLINLILMGAIAVISIVLSAQYYRYVLSQSVPINLSNVISIYFLNVAAFGMVYYFYYTIDQSAFQYSSPPIQVEPTMMVVSGAHHLMKMQFFVFSACQSLNADYFRIVPKSSIISILGLVQSIFTLVLIALVVSSYVAQKLKTKP